MSYSDLLLRKFDNTKERAKDAIFSLMSCVCQPAATVKVNGRNCEDVVVVVELLADYVTDRILKALGEGGFSFVYLVRDEVSAVRNYFGFCRQKS